MNTLLTFPLAERIGWMLLHSLWQITAIALALIVGRWFFRSPQARHLLAMLALVACVAWPVAGLWQAGKAEPRKLLPPPAPMRLNAWPLITLIILASGFGIQPRVQADAPPRGRILDRNGVVLAESPSIGERRYPKQTLGAQVLGFAKGFSPPQPKPVCGGSAGIELSQEATLAVKQDVHLTLDANIQALAESILQKRAPRGGAAVVLDPNTGDILALASWPTFNPNELVHFTKEERFLAVLKDPTHPFVGRAFSRPYYPASTFKLVTALAGLKSGAIDEKSIFDGSLEFKIGDRTFRNWSKVPEGPIDLVTAIKRSCNTWFYQAALKTGADPITSMASDLGFGQPTGLPLQENKGFVPTDAYYQQTQGHNMLPGVLASLSIGQITTATPLQVAVATAAISNGGKVLAPRLLKTREPAQVRTDLIAKGLRPEHLDLVKRGMIESVQGDGGTSHAAQIEGITVAAKTGSAQWVVGENRDKSKWLAWFTGFAPADNPKLAVVVVYEGSFGESVSGGAVAAPIAREIMEGALKKMKAVNWIDALDQQWLETASRLSVPANPGTTILYHPNAQNLSAGPIRAADIALIDAKNPIRVQFFHGDGRITVGKDGKATIDADEATFVTSLDVLPEHWQRAVKGQPKKPAPPPAWITAEWLQSAKSTTVPFKVPLSNPLMDPPGSACVFYDGEMKHHEKPDAEQVTSFTGNVVALNGQLMISGQNATVMISSTGNMSFHGPVSIHLVKSGDLPALDAAIEKAKQGNEKKSASSAQLQKAATDLKSVATRLRTESLPAEAVKQLEEALKNLQATLAKRGVSLDPGFVKPVEPQPAKPRRRYPNPWPLDSFKPADIIVSSDGRSYDYVPGRGSSLPLLDERRSTVRLDYEPPHYSKSMPDLISTHADADSTTIRNLLRDHLLGWPLLKGQADFEYRDVGPKQPDHQVSPPASKVVEPHLVPS
ncbi:MAG: hypothetical protein JNM99_01050 [Verrucomicrobiaceae bacterium]|nr:hypothetical protein [Verrucomicrobiaceae bacterium]